MNWKYGVVLVTLSIFFPSTQGCRMEVCRRKRSPGAGDDDNLVFLRGCSGQTAAWVTQMAFCLNISALDVAFGMREWYSRTYQDCTSSCNAVREGTTETTDITFCVDCFERSLIRSGILENFDNISAVEDVFPCVESYVVPFLNEAPATLEVTSENRQVASARVDIPSEARPQDWWALAVRLPCKPPLFQYFDANCINSFADDARSRDFILAQNRENAGNDIRFIVRFDDVCRFSADQIEIVWEKSVPGFAFPQISSFPTSFPPRGDQVGNIMFDTDDFTMYEEIVGDHIEENRPNPRRKRSAGYDDSDAPMLGIIMPCQVRSFRVTDPAGNRMLMKSNGARHLIEPAIMTNNGEKIILQNYNMINFTVDFGYENTGCTFASNEPSTVVDPPPGWLDGRERITCYTCRNAASEEECRRSGTTRCQRGEICQSETRQVTPGRVSISKMCKQSNACSNNWINNNRRQCKPGQPASVCRCCCYSDRCNRNADHCT